MKSGKRKRLNRNHVTSSLPNLKISTLMKRRDRDLTDDLVVKGKRYTKFPSIHEPAIVRYNKKALFESDEEVRTFKNYRSYKPHNTRFSWKNSQIFLNYEPRVYIDYAFNKGGMLCLTNKDQQEDNKKSKPVAT